jgi:hypothetical protein
MSAHDFDGRTGEGSDRANAPPGWGLIRLASLLVPAERRADWRAEWRAELASAAADAAERGDSPPGTRMRLVLRAMASTADAVSLRRLRGGAGPGPAGRDALRMVRRQPGFVAAVAVTLALGMGATTAIFSVVDAILLHPLPFHEPDRIVEIGSYGRPVDPDMVNALRNETLLFESVKTHRARSVVLTDAGEPRQLRVEAYEPGFLELLGIAPKLGRTFLPEEAVQGGDHVILLGDEIFDVLQTVLGESGNVTQVFVDRIEVGEELFALFGGGNLRGLQPGDLEFKADYLVLGVLLGRNKGKPFRADGLARLVELFGCGNKPLFVFERGTRKHLLERLGANGWKPRTSTTTTVISRARRKRASSSSSSRRRRVRSS